MLGFPPAASLSRLARASEAFHLPPSTSRILASVSESSALMLPRDPLTETREQPAQSELSTHRLSLQGLDPLTSEHTARRLFSRIHQALGPGLENDHSRDREDQGEIA